MDKEAVSKTLPKYCIVVYYLLLSTILMMLRHTVLCVKERSSNFKVQLESELKTHISI